MLLLLQQFLFEADSNIVGKNMSSNLLTTMKAVHVVKSKEIDLILREGPFQSKSALPRRLSKKTGTVRALFSRYKDALDIILDTEIGIKASSVGSYLHEYLSSCKSVQFLETTTPAELLQLYVGTRFPAIFKEITGRDNILRIGSLKRRRILEKNVKIDTISKLIVSGDGIYRILDGQGKKLINDLDKSVNLMSYYVTDRSSFIPITGNDALWNELIYHLPFNQVQKLSKIFCEADNAMRNAELPANAEDLLYDLNLMWQVRSGHLPLAGLAPKGDAVVEGRDILRKIENGRVPDFFTLGKEVYLKNESLQNCSMPIGLIASNTLIAVSKTGRISEAPKIAADKFSSEWQKMQSSMLSQKKAKTVGVVESYDEIGRMLQNQEIDFSVLPIPGNFFAESYGYKNVRDPHLKGTNIGITHALLLANRECMKDSPAKAKLLIDKCHALFGDFHNRRFEYFIGVKETGNLNEYLAEKLAVSKKRTKRMVSEKTYFLRLKK